MEQRLARHGRNHARTGSDPIPVDPLIPVVRMWVEIGTSTIAPNTQYLPDFSAGEFKTNDAADEIFQARTYPYTDGRYFAGVTSGSSVSTNYLTITGPGVFYVQGSWDFGEILSSYTPTQTFYASLRVQGPTISLPEVDDPADNNIVPLQVAIDRDPTPDIMSEPEQATVDTFPPVFSGITTTVGSPYHMRRSWYAALRNDSASMNVHFDLTHAIRNNAGSTITPGWLTYASMTAIRLGDFY